MRRLLVGCRFWILSAGIMLLAGVLLRPAFRAGGVSEWQVEEIRKGMTRREVEAALGAPPIEVSSPGLRRPRRHHLIYDIGGRFRRDDRELIVVLDENDVVVNQYVLNNGPDRRPLSKRIARRWD